MSIQFLSNAWTSRIALLAIGSLMAFASSDAFAQTSPLSTNPSAMNSTASSSAPTTEPLTVLSRETLQPGLTMAKLSNGLTILIQENHTAPNATVRCFVKNTGSMNETGHLGAGLSHVLEHVVSGGSTATRSEAETEDMVDRMGGVTNAFTSINVTAYFIDCPSKDVNKAVDIIADEMQHIAFVPKEFNRELKVVQQELRDGEASRARVMWKLMSETRYLKHPARLPVIGYLDVLQRASNDDIISFYKQRYIPNNQIFVVVGDVKTDEILERVRKNYEGTPRGKMNDIVVPREPEQVSPRMAVREMDGATFDVAVFWPTVTIDSPDMYPLDILDYVLAEGASSLLVKKYCMDNPLALSIGASSSTPNYAPGMFAVQMSLTEENYPAVVDQVVADIYKMRDILIPEELLEKAKKQKVAEQIFGLQTIQAQADNLAQSYIATGDPLFDNTYVEQIKKVTAQDVQRVARKYLVPERFNKVVITPLGKSQQATQSAADAVNSPIKQLTLDNGVTVLTKQIPNLPLVSMQVYVKGGAVVETPEKAGVSLLSASMFEKGCQGMTAAQIAEYFDLIGGTIGCTSARNTTSGSILTLKEDFPKASEILAECFLRPTFPEDEFAKLKIQTLGLLQRKKADPRSEARDAFFDALPKTSSFSHIVGGTIESVSNLTLDDLKKYHQTYVQPDGMVVAIFGDISTEDAVAQAKKLFGNLKQTVRPVVNYDLPNTIEESVVKHVKTEKTTAMILIGYECPSMLDVEDYNAMYVLNGIVTGCGYPGGWTFPELRGAGLVYSVHGIRMAGISSGYFTVIAQTRPDAVDEVVARIRKNIEKAKAGTITEEEFEKAKEMIIAMEAQENTTASEQASQAAVDTILGFGPEYQKGSADRINAVTLDQVKAVAKKYLTKSVQVTLSNKDE